MSARDPAGLLTVIEAPIRPRAAFADELLERLLHELERPERRAFPRRTARTLVIAVALLLLLAGVATATYIVVRIAGDRSAPPSGTLTLLLENPNGPAKIAAVGPHGLLRTVWECPHRVFCGDLTSLDWSPDGRRVAFTLDELGGVSGYVGLHIVDVRTGRDLHVAGLHLKHPLANQPMSVLVAQAQRSKRVLGCRLPQQLAWSADGRRLAYSCGSIFTIRADGTHRVRIPTGRTVTATAPSWSPDGRRIVFATGARRDGRVRSSIYVVDVDGSGLRLLARDAASPSWSRDGSRIAYDSTAGVRLITPAGARRTEVGPMGPPTFSPDGRQIAIATSKGIIVVDARTLQGSLVTSETGGGIFGEGRPSWYPGANVPGVPPPPRRPANCVPC
jgi:Tol biopolymer transport system component